MKKNVAGQKIGCQMVNATDGSAFTGSVTVYVTGDAGTQAVGSVGSGACTHEGNGYHTYAPAQAETNYDLMAFTFVGTGAIPATVQVFTNFPQTGDAFDRLGAPAGASVSADVAAVKTQTAAIEVDTQDIQSRIPAALVSGRIDASVGAMANNVMTAAAAASDLTTELQSGLATASALSTVAGYLDTEIASIKSVTDKLDTTLTTAVGSPGEYQFTADALENAPAGTGGGGGGPSAATIASAVWSDATRTLTAGTNIVLAKGTGITGFNDLDAAGVRGAVGLAAANLDTQLSTIDTVVDAILVDTAEIGAAGAGLTALASAANLAVVAGYLDTEIGAIKAKTDNLPASPAATGDIPSAASIADAVLDEALSGHSTAGSLGKAISDSDLRGSRTVIRGTVDSGASTTSIPTSAFSPAGASADQFKGRIVVFDNDTATAALRGEATDITASSNSATPTLTVTALSATPAAGDSFSVL